MKKILSIVALLCMTLAAMAQSNKSIIKCQFDNLPNDSLYVQVVYTSHQEDYSIKTVYAKKGKYQIEVADDYAVNIVFAEPLKPGQRGHVVDEVTQLTVLPGEKITVKGDVKGKAVIKGSAYNDEMKKVESLYKAQTDEMHRLIEERQAKIDAGEDEEKMYNVYTPLFQAQRDQRNAIIGEYIKSNPDTPVSVYYAANFMFDKKEYMEYISEKGLNGVMKYYIAEMKKYADQMNEQKAKMEALQKATNAPDFTAKDLNGNDLTLSSLYNKGNYILLDFWGSWCHWCIKALPKMKKVYEAHKDKLQILSIDCNDTEDKWRKAVADHEITWLNVKNDEKVNDIPSQYGIQGYPTFIFIDPSGKILKVQTGADDEFYQYLEDVLNK